MTSFISRLSGQVARLIRSCATRVIFAVFYGRTVSGVVMPAKMTRNQLDCSVCCLRDTLPRYQQAKPSNPNTYTCMCSTRTNRFCTPLPEMPTLGIRVPHDTDPAAPVKITTHAARAIEVLDQQLERPLPSSLMFRIAQCLGVRTGTEFRVPRERDVVIVADVTSVGGTTVRIEEIGLLCRIPCTPVSVVVRNNRLTVSEPHRISVDLDSSMATADMNVWITSGTVKLSRVDSVGHREDEECPEAKRTRRN